MRELMSSPNFLVGALAVIASVFLLSVVFVTLARFYQRCGADEALVRTGAGGNRVVIGGGVFVYPILHELMHVSLRSIKLSVDRSGHNALVTRDKIKANVTTELYIRVEPTAEDVLSAARSFGESNMDEKAVERLIEGKLTDALRSVAANSTFMDLHSQRKQFAEEIQHALEEELKKNGLKLENVSITALAMVPVTELDPQDFFDAEGLRTITEQIQSNAEKTNAIQREKEVAILQQNVTARKAALEMEQDQKYAEADQGRRVAEYTATQQSETAKAVYTQEQSREVAALEKQRAVMEARIAQEQSVAVAQAARQRAEREAMILAEKAQAAAEIAKQKEIEAATIEKQKVVGAAEIERQKVLAASSIEKERAVEAAEVVKQQAIETARIAKEIAVTQSLEQAARAAALKATAEAEREHAAQGIVTVEATAKAKREKDIAVIKAEEGAQQSRIAAEREAFKRKLEAETQAAARKADAEGEAQARRAMAEGEVAQAEGVARAQQLAAEAKAVAMRTEAQAEADRVRITAEARATAAEREAAAISVLAEATRKRGEADAQARRKLVEAENQVDTRLLLRDVALRAIENLPAVTRELMSPAKAIREIKVLQMQGGPGAMNGGGEGTGSQGPFGSASPILKTLMEAGAAYPLLREMMAFAKVDGDKLADTARGWLTSLPEELKGVLAADPALAAKIPDAHEGAEPITVRDERGALLDAHPEIQDERATGAGASVEAPRGL